MSGNLPWSLVFVGVFIALIAELFGIPVLPFAVGMYLPIYTTTGIMVGGVIRLIIDRKKGTETEKKARANRGVLFASGMIAGEGLIGVLLAVFAFAGVDISLKQGLNQIGSIVFFVILIALFVCMIGKKPKTGSDR